MQKRNFFLCKEEIRLDLILSDNVVDDVTCQSSHCLFTPALKSPKLQLSGNTDACSEFHSFSVRIMVFFVHRTMRYAYPASDKDAAGFCGILFCEPTHESQSGGSSKAYPPKICVCTLSHRQDFMGSHMGIIHAHRWLALTSGPSCGRWPGTLGHLPDSYNRYPAHHPVVLLQRNEIGVTPTSAP